MAVLDVINERARQMNVEGYTIAHDDQHIDGGLATAAGCYAFMAIAGQRSEAPWGWPWERERWKPAKQRQMLVKAGALILAEIERLDRMEDENAKEPL
jgi:hypothetical protein